MADLLTHALIAFSITTVLSWRYTSITSSYITAAMVGSTLPDLTRIGLIIDSVVIEETLNIPFSWPPLPTLGGVLITATIITALVDKKHTKPVFLLLGLGAASHLILDIFLINASGHSYAVLFPFSSIHPATPGFYLSTNVWPVIVAGLIAIFVWRIDTSKFKKKNLI